MFRSCMCVLIFIYSYIYTYRKNTLEWACVYDSVFPSSNICPCVSVIKTHNKFLRFAENETRTRVSTYTV